MIRRQSKVPEVVSTGRLAGARDVNAVHVEVRALIAYVFLFALCVAPVAAQSQLQFDPAAFLVRINEATIDNENAVTSSDCMLILPDGRFHLERRSQHLPNPVATLRIFESSLGAAQLQYLRDILHDQSIRNLPPYAPPIFPMNLPWFANVRVKIVREPEVQDVGYWIWRGGAADASPNSTPDNIKKGWQESEVALRPLLQWFHGVE